MVKVTSSTVKAMNMRKGKSLVKVKSRNEEGVQQALESVLTKGAELQSLTKMSDGSYKVITVMGNDTTTFFVKLNGSMLEVQASNAKSQ